MDLGRTGGVTTRGEVRQLPQDAKRQGALGGAFGRRDCLLCTTEFSRISKERKKFFLWLQPARWLGFPGGQITITLTFLVGVHGGRLKMFASGRIRRSYATGEDWGRERERKKGKRKEMKGEEKGKGGREWSALIGRVTSRACLSVRLSRTRAPNSTTAGHGKPEFT